MDFPFGHPLHRVVIEPEKLGLWEYMRGTPEYARHELEKKFALAVRIGALCACGPYPMNWGENPEIVAKVKHAEERLDETFRPLVFPPNSTSGPKC